MVLAAKVGNAMMKANIFRGTHYSQSKSDQQRDLFHSGGSEADDEVVWLCLIQQCPESCFSSIMCLGTLTVKILRLLVQPFQKFKNTPRPSEQHVFLND